ncbi:Leucine-rich repeat-containing protein 43 [Galemys pyrenaicus]|uniref:Leucine-rich repeat-containing protein 43 n=1 Tax=Galemys pyrenaicus TaxID=202257 RepID=A0A8J6ANK3_GALPY|nr:Leucine-rich repeat-containing protein 43 [Galemys pyrenaicus]
MRTEPAGACLARAKDPAPCWAGGRAPARGLGPGQRSSSSTWERRTAALLPPPASVARRLRLQPCGASAFLLWPCGSSWRLRPVVLLGLTPLGLERTRPEEPAADSPHTVAGLRPQEQPAAAGMEAPHCTVSAAVQEQLRQLCLREFPCGVGSWVRAQRAGGPGRGRRGPGARRSHRGGGTSGPFRSCLTWGGGQAAPPAPQNQSRFLPRTWRAWKELVPREEEAAGPGEETVAALLDLACSPQSPWALPEGSGAEAHFLRALAVRNPPLIRDSFFCAHFRSLRVVDKGVDEVDRGLLRFLRLEELVLSANHIQEIDAGNLPPTLKVLELYGNKMRSLRSLCARPPPLLQHLGLGHNQLLGPSESVFVTSTHWPNLVSLDLSFNDLTGLQAVVASLRSLPRLRLLLLQGNPLALVPYYRGFTLDSLARLCVLDDITVSPSEKHQFRGLSRSGELLAQEAQLVVTIGNAVGLPDRSLLEPEPGPQGPFVTYSYYVTYDFVEDEGSSSNQYGSVLAEIVKPFSSEQLGEELPEEPDSSQASADLSQVSELEEPSMLTAMPRSTNSAEELAKLRPKIDARLFPAPGTVLFSTAHKPWAETVSFGYEMHHTLKDLVPLKAFLLSGTMVTVVEEKVGVARGAALGVTPPAGCTSGSQPCLLTAARPQILSWPMEPLSESASLVKKRRASEREKEKDKKARDTKDKAGKEEKERKSAKKKKELPKDLRQDPPILRVLGSSLVALEPLLAGEPLVTMLCRFGVIPVLETEKLALLRVRLWPTRREPGQRWGQTRRRASGIRAGPGRLRPSRVSVSVSAEKRSWPRAADLEAPPEALTVEVQFQLGQCRSAEEALRAVPLLGAD